MTRRIFTKAAVLIVPFFLTGCWFSPSPLLNPENASEIPFAGSYLDPDGTENTIVISKSGDGAAYTLSQEDVTFELYFLAVDNEWYVVQMTDPTEEPEVVDPSSDLEITRNPTDIAGYNLLRWSDGELRAYDAECNDEMADIPSVELNEVGCLIGSVEALASITRRYAEMVDEAPDEFEFETLTRLNE